MSQGKRTGSIFSQVEHAEPGAILVARDKGESKSENHPGSNIATLQERAKKAKKAKKQQPGCSPMVTQQGYEPVGQC
jgi:hypothetical protein